MRNFMARYFPLVLVLFSFWFWIAMDHPLWPVGIFTAVVLMRFAQLDVPRGQWWLLPSAMAIGIALGDIWRLYEPGWAFGRLTLRFVISVAVLFGIFVLLQYSAIRGARRPEGKHFW